MTDFDSERSKLIGAIQLASELEHALCCAYLFCAHSMKRHGDPGTTPEQIEDVRRWRKAVLRIARQEMEHLAITANLLAAMGEAAHLKLPQFPVRPGIEDLDFHHIALNRFSPESLGEFILYELPEKAGTPKEQELRQVLTESHLAEDKDLLRKLNTTGRTGIAALYKQAIAERICVIARSMQREKDLFIGTPDSQVSNTLAFYTFPPIDPGARLYDVRIETVTDQDSALAAVEAIRREGEGGGAGDDTSHFAVLSQIYIELSRHRCRDGDFEPSRRVVSNPIYLTRFHDLRVLGATDQFVVTYEPAIEAMRIYDAAYELLLRMLTRFFATANTRDRQLLAVQSVAFFPLMTLVLRPLGDMLTDMPAADDLDERAGASFNCGRGVDFVPDSDLALRVFASELRALHERTRRLACSQDLEESMRERFEFMAENLWRMAYNLTEGRQDGAT